MEQSKYVNRFSFIANNHGDEAQLTFYQSQPIWDNDTSKITNIETTETCRLFMTIATAKQLQKVISECIADVEMKKDIIEE